MKRILVVGNGFDLAHGLPTKYSDFLYFMALCIDHLTQWRTWRVYRDIDNDSKQLAEQTALAGILLKPYKNTRVKNIFDENIVHIQNTFTGSSFKDFEMNDLLLYFLCIYDFRQNLNSNFQWIDLEAELMQLLEYLNKLSDKVIYTTTVPQLTNNSMIFQTFRFSTLNSYLKKLTKTPREKIKSMMFAHLFEQLEQLSSLLKFYLKLVLDDFYKEPQKVFQFSPKIDACFPVTHIISFNYTNTSSIYNPDAEVYYVNGCLTDKHIILGTENTFPSVDKSYVDNNLHLFFKNVQRILYDFRYKHTKWLNSRETLLHKSADGKNTIDHNNNVYIVGHSLAFSDKNILLDIFENADHVTIFYYSYSDKIDKLANLYKILPDELFYRYINNDDTNSKISLKPQSDISLAD